MRDYNREIVILLLDRINEVIVIVVTFLLIVDYFGAVAVRGFFTHIGFSTLNLCVLVLFLLFCCFVG